MFYENRNNDFKGKHNFKAKISGRCYGGNVKKGKSVEVDGVGAGAVNQAVKSIAIARGYVSPNGIDIICIPTFIDVEIEGEKRTGIKFIILTK